MNREASSFKLELLNYIFEFWCIEKVIEIDTQKDSYLPNFQALF